MVLIDFGPTVIPTPLGMPSRQQDTCLPPPRQGSRRCHGLHYCDSRKGDFANVLSYQDCSKLGTTPSVLATLPFKFLIKLTVAREMADSSVDDLFSPVAVHIPYLLRPTAVAIILFHDRL